MTFLYHNHCRYSTNAMRDFEKNSHADARIIQVASNLFFIGSIMMPLSDG